MIEDYSAADDGNRARRRGRLSNSHGQSRRTMRNLDVVVRAHRSRDGYTRCSRRVPRASNRRKPRRTSPRRALETACRRSPNSPTWLTASDESSLIRRSIVPIEELLPPGTEREADRGPTAGRSCAVTGAPCRPTAATCLRTSDYVARRTEGCRAWEASVPALDRCCLLGRDGNDPLFLQAKEAQASVLERFVGQAVRQLR